MADFSRGNTERPANSKGGERVVDVIHATDVDVAWLIINHEVAALWGHLGDLGDLMG
ncbi:hypothetical protein Lpp223_2668 [Lacticaseibacillus paracasei subsp. paracasei Lpp223]|nr:hypothetical protein Lpp223_2668 [Lacticaseibacillus paracasei subsp. paracasei Lpp223]